VDEELRSKNGKFGGEKKEGAGRRKEGEHRSETKKGQEERKRRCSKEEGGMKH
jgi:hypothetical protein